MMKNFSYRSLHSVPWILITIGIVLRLSLFIANRSLYIDEADLIGNITHRSFVGLTQPLDDEQHAPLGFLWFEKAALLVLGDSEYTFRFYALLMGIASIVLFYTASRRLISHSAALIALSLFTFSPGLIRYSSEAKQYMGDVTFTLLLLYLFSRSKHVYQVYAVLIGALVPWFSHASIFILCSIAFTKWKKILFALPVWIGSILLEYFLILRFSIARPDSGHYWYKTFAPFPPRSIADIQWTVNAFVRYFKFIWPSPISIYLIVFVLLMIVGIVSLLKKNRPQAIILTIPFILVYVASGFHAYPLVERLLLFLAPFVFLLVAHGADVVLSLSKKFGQAAFLTGATLLLTILLYHPIASATTNLLNPPTTEEIKTVLSFYTANRRPGDVLYVSSGAQSAFRYYAPKFDLSNDTVVYGGYVRGHGEQIIREITSLGKNPRIWVLFSHMNSASAKDIDIITQYLTSTMKLIDFRQSVGAAIYLFDGQ